MVSSTIAAVYSDDVDRLFAELFPSGGRGGSNESRAPVDVYLVEGDPPALTVEIGLAAVRPEAVDVALHHDELVIRGERRREPVEGRRVYQHAEIPWGPFERRVRLNVPVDPAAAKASFEHGLLRISLPLAPRPPLRRVQISVQGTA